MADDRRHATSQVTSYEYLISIRGNMVGSVGLSDDRPDPGFSIMQDIVL